MDIAFDIETVPNMEMIDRLPPPEVKTGNLKDPAKIAAKEEAAKAEQIEKMALNPLYGRICSFVTIDENENTVAYCIPATTDREETNLIEYAFSTLNSGRIITYNGTEFDLPFLYRRAVILGIDPREFSMPPLSELTGKYNNERHVDLMTVWCGWKGYEKLDNLAKVITNDCKIEIDFRYFPEMIKTAEGRAMLLQYCMQDVKLTMKLWSRFHGILVK